MSGLNTEKAGRALAVKLLEEIESNDLTMLCDIDAQFREGRPQLNIVLKYLDEIAQATPAVRAGFASILTGYLAITTGGSVPDISFMQTFVESGPDRSPMQYPDRSPAH